MTAPPWDNQPISVIVPHFNDLARLDTCLSSLEQQQFPGEFELIVVDNNSPCGLARVEDVVAGRARVLTCMEPGAGPARNAGVAAARGKTLAFIDADCIAHPDWLAEGVKALATTDIVGGGVDVSVRHPGHASGAEAFEQIFAFDNRRYVEQEKFTVTANLFTRKALFEAVGGFRGTVSEDTEWCRRAVRHGYAIAYSDAARVSHPAREDWQQLRKKWQRINREAFALSCERPRGRLRWILRSLALPASIIVHGPRVFASRKLSGFAERIAAFVTLARIRLWRFGDALRLGWQGPQRPAH